ncbi:Hypothetical_protein [Hexamita inflata]|uniref:Hypothetical_protein n=1 Tax=Hexamita inflata TaxID=28002 RepID=A0AA86RBG6_9EUKA|nr:Hypothetical protein HINF_LOCUS59218 [Hexamita inflata]
MSEAIEQESAGDTVIVKKWGIQDYSQLDPERRIGLFINTKFKKIHVLLRKYNDLAVSHASLDIAQFADLPLDLDSVVFSGCNLLSILVQPCRLFCFCERIQKRSRERVRFKKYFVEALTNVTNMMSNIPLVKVVRFDARQMIIIYNTIQYIKCFHIMITIQSAELASSRISMAKGMPSTSLQDWKAVTAPLLHQKRRWYDVGGFPYRSACTKQPRYAHGCLYPSRWLPWLRRCAQRTQYLKLMIIRVNIQFLSIQFLQKTELVQTKIK